MTKKRDRLGEPDVAKYFGDDAGSDRRRARKDAQLCAQVREALSLALMDSGHEDLERMWVVEVRPAPHAGNLRVVTEAPIDVDVASVHAELERRAGALRYQVAQAIHRKKAPSLSFVVIPAIEEEEP